MHSTGSMLTVKSEDCRLFGRHAFLEKRSWFSVYFSSEIFVLKPIRTSFTVNKNNCKNDVISSVHLRSTSAKVMKQDRNIVIIWLYNHKEVVYYES